MKYYRKCRLFRRRQQRQKFFLLIGLFLTSSFGFLLLNLILSSEDVKTMYFNRNTSLALGTNCRCSKSSLIVFEHGECFFDHLICYPGYAGDHCEKQLKNETYRSHCPIDVHRTQWTHSLSNRAKKQCLQSKSAQQEWNTSCLFLCFYHRLTGVIQIPEIFWHRSLKNELDYWKENPMAVDDRVYEHVEGFHGYKMISLEIQSIIEIGAGPFTQIQYLLTPFRSIKEITLIEPNALDYMKLNNCAYRGGHLRGHPVSIIAESVEIIMKKRRQNQILSKPSTSYSALISINVIEHVNDALEYFRGLYDLLEDDGLLIFHERWYDTPQQADCVLDRAEGLHPIRITKWMIDTFLDQFEPLYVNLNRTKRQMRSPCKEHGIYFIGRKTSNCK